MNLWPLISSVSIWSMGLGYQYIDIEPNDLLSYQLNLRYQF
ncbi:hypothetical protein [Shewanella xiamenensis]|nr:hypothetical protein [Shewanella xiamenensis]